MKLTIIQEAPLSDAQKTTLRGLRETGGDFRMKSASYDDDWIWEIIVTEVTVTLFGNIDIYGFSRGCALRGDWKPMNGVTLSRYVAEGVNE